MIHVSLVDACIRWCPLQKPRLLEETLIAIRDFQVDVHAARLPLVLWLSPGKQLV